ncbi:alpha/beta fold hydrolase [Flagellimonas sp. S3867]|uniref:alpha/beta hydrolase n=1 Tax=Flagellimonas sp. S3867 TaxID=2768063 RepID=UPI001689739D|nr:alpha/beta fold hydrolase [Flagellimonas sp. S3867]
MNKIRLIAHLVILIVTVLLSITSCSVEVDVDEVVTIGPKFEDLQSWELLATVSENQIRNLVSQNEPGLTPIITSRQLKDIKVYKITYNTIDVDGNNIIVSGLVIIPKNSVDLPLVSYQHGTLLTDDDAPSSYNTEKLATLFAMTLASANYAVIMPDYLGYGVSRNYPHPFQHRKTLGSTSYDMIRAVKEGLNFVDNLIINDKLFITGYSEGGFATLALQKHIEENSILEVTMSAPASGVYNSSAFFQEMMLLNEDYNYPGLAMWVFDSYDRIYNLNRDWSDYINEPYATIIEDVSHPFDFFSTDISKNPQDLYTEEFRNGLVNGSDIEFLNIISDNDVFNWTPNYPITFFYGTDDNLVFPLNSETAYENLSTDSANVDRVIYEGEDHFTTGILYINDVFELFESLR